MRGWLWLTLTMPFVLLGMLAVMDWLEQSMRRDDISVQLVNFLEYARVDEVEQFVRDGYAPTLERYWERAGAGRYRIGV